MNKKRILQIFAFFSILLYFEGPVHAANQKVDLTPILSLLFSSHAEDHGGIETGTASLDDCGIFDENFTNDNITCLQDCSGTWGGTAITDDCGICDADMTNNNTTCVQDCLGVWGGTAITDGCGVCDVDMTNNNITCTQDCNGIWNGTAIIDGCGTCDNNPNNDCMQDCLGVWGGTAITDDCGVCDVDMTNNNTTCTQDCNGTWGGTAIIDDCGTCDNNPNNDCIQDCLGAWGGNASIDDCGICDANSANNNTTCVQDCLGIWDGIAITDDCGVCDDDMSNDNTTCTQDCMGVWGGIAYVDACGLCVDASTGAFPCTEFVEVLSSTGRIWMDRNLGASRPALSFDDIEACGYLFQWGRLNDGHQSRLSSTTSVPGTTDVPGHNEFILENMDWRIPQNSNLWQGISGTNNPCPPDFRLPTQVELDAEIATWGSKNSAGAFEGSLKLVVGGYRGPSAGTISYGDSRGFYWSSTVQNSNEIDYSRALYINETDADVGEYGRSKGFSIRCIKDQ